MSGNFSISSFRPLTSFVESPSEETHNLASQTFYQPTCQKAQLCFIEGLPHQILLPDDTPLHLAVLAGKLDIVKLLLEHGALPNQENHQRYTPLHLAVLDGKLDIVKLLLEHGALPNQGNLALSFQENTPLYFQGDTPLYLAVQTGNQEVVKLLLENGALPNQGNNKGDTPLYLAVQSEKWEVVKLLLENGALPAKINVRGDTPLALAIRKDNLDVIRLFLECEPRIDLTAENNQLLTLLAFENPNERVLELLVQYGASGNIPDEHKITLIHRASTMGPSKHLNILLQAQSPDKVILNPRAYFTSRTLHDCMSPTQMPKLIQKIHSDELVKSKKQLQPITIAQNQCNVVARMGNGEYLILENTNVIDVYRYLNDRCLTSKTQPQDTDIYLLKEYASPGHIFTELTSLVTEEHALLEQASPFSPDPDEIEEESFGFYPAGSPARPGNTQPELLKPFGRMIFSEKTRSWLRESYVMINDQAGEISPERDYKTHANTKNHLRLVFPLNKSQAMSVRAYKRKVTEACRSIRPGRPGGDECVYHLTRRNCASFGQEVLSITGNEMPLADFFLPEQLDEGGITMEYKAINFVKYHSRHSCLRPVIETGTSTAQDGATIALAFVVYRLAKSVYRFFQARF